MIKARVVKKVGDRRNFHTQVHSEFTSATPVHARESSTEIGITENFSDPQTKSALDTNDREIIE